MRIAPLKEVGNLMPTALGGIAGMFVAGPVGATLGAGTAQFLHDMPQMSTPSKVSPPVPGDAIGAVEVAAGNVLEGLFAAAMLGVAAIRGAVAGTAVGLATMVLPTVPGVLLGVAGARCAELALQQAAERA
jgi:hypothetical protein